MKKLFIILITVCAVFLSAQDQPFQWDWKWEGNSFSVILNAPEGSYVYENMTKVELIRNGKALTAQKLPAFREIEDPALGKVKIYVTPALWNFSVKPDDLPFTLALEWQGCGKNRKSGESICFLPKSLEKKFDRYEESGLLYGSGKQTKQADPLNGFRIERIGYGYMNAEKFIAFLRGEKMHNMFSGKGFLLVILLSLLGGVLLNFTPCVLPMIPVNLAIIGADTGDRRSALQRSFVYAAGIALAYGGTGLAAVLGGASFGILDSFWQFNLGAAAVFILLGLSMFDLFTIDLSRYGSGLKMPSAARLAGVFLLGALSALLAGACVAPVVIAVLIHSAGLYASGNIAGLFLPFALGIGMGAPWPLIALGIAHLPKPGMWMVKVKYAFGIVILLIGCYYAWLGISLLRSSSAEASVFSSSGIEQAMKRSIQDGKPVLIDFSAEWCKNCKAMELNTLKDSEVRKTLESFHAVRFDATAISSPEVKAVLDRYNVTGLPAFVIINRIKEESL